MLHTLILIEETGEPRHEVRLLGLISAHGVPQSEGALRLQLCVELMLLVLLLLEHFHGEIVAELKQVVQREPTVLVGVHAKQVAQMREIKGIVIWQIDSQNIREHDVVTLFRAAVLLVFLRDEMGECPLVT